MQLLARYIRTKSSPPPRATDLVCHHVHQILSAIMCIRSCPPARASNLVRQHVHQILSAITCIKSYSPSRVQLLYFSSILDKASVFNIQYIFNNNNYNNIIVLLRSCGTDLSIHFQPSRPTIIWKFLLVTLTLSPSTLNFETDHRKCEIALGWRQLDTGLRFLLNWDGHFTRDSNLGLSHDLHAQQARGLPLTPPWRH